MKPLVLASVLAASACSSTTKAYITASWSFADLTAQAAPTPTSCPEGYDTAVIVSQELDADLNLVGTPTLDTFPCDALTGTSVALPASWFLEEVDITEGAATCPGAGCYTQSAGTFLDLTTTSQTVTIPPVLDNGGYVHLEWALLGDAPDTVPTCAQAGVASIEVVDADNAGALPPVSDVFPCASALSVDIGAGEGFSSPLLAGTYNISVTALDAAMNPVGAVVVLSKQVVSAPDGITDLGMVAIPIGM